MGQIMCFLLYTSCCPQACHPQVLLQGPSTKAFTKCLTVLFGIREQALFLTWREADISDGLVVPCEGVHELPRRHIKHSNCAVHDPARQTLAIWAESHAQYKLLPLVLLIRLQESLKGQNISSQVILHSPSGQKPLLSTLSALRSCPPFSSSILLQHCHQSRIIDAMPSCTAGE